MNKLVPATWLPWPLKKYRDYDNDYKCTVYERFGHIQETSSPSSKVLDETDYAAILLFVSPISVYRPLGLKPDR